MLRFFIRLLIVVVVGTTVKAQKAAEDSVKIAVVGLAHGHAKLVFRFLNSNNVKIIGIAEQNKDIIARYKIQFQLPDSIFYTTLDEMLLEKRPEGVVVFTSTKEHLSVVEKCAPKGIHVMVEKPLAIDLKDAKKMQELADRHNIKLMTNYETTWHPSLLQGYKRVFKNNEIGELRKVIFHHGNNGTNRGRGVDEFIDWLTDPLLNGGGAIMDFGCYGANIITWFNKGEKPLSVYAITHQYKPHLYPNVDDDAIIILEYLDYHCVLMASWNWAIPRKDVELYGNKGQLMVKTPEELSYLISPDKTKTVETFPPMGYPINEPLEYFADVIRNKKELEPFSQASIENNIMVMEILDAARSSAKKERRLD